MANPVDQYIKTAFLTFDDGPSENTVKILDILDFYAVKATFFVVGREIENHLNIYKRIVANGHSIGNHTYSHNYSSIYASVDSLKKDVYALDNLLLQVVGYKPDLLRFPGGSNNHSSWKYGGQELMLQIIKEMLKEGYQYFDWNVDSQDTSDYLPPLELIVNSVLSGAAKKEQAVILLHDAPVKITTVEALPEIITGLIKLGFHFERLTKESASCQFKILNPTEPSTRPWSMWKAPITSEADGRSPELLNAVIKQCNVTTAIRYRVNQQNKKETYCNIFAWDITSALNAEIPHWVLTSDQATPAKPDLNYTHARETNSSFIFDWLSKHGPKYGWNPSDALKALHYANTGHPAIAIIKGIKDKGHIAVIRPGAYHTEKGVPIAQAGNINFDDGFLTDGFGASSSYVVYYFHQ
jgi:peptidoglycan-N-acetylglucosamine deacetylase